MQAAEKIYCQAPGYFKHKKLMEIKCFKTTTEKGVHENAINQ